ncbi:reprolysin-like metallopeptidase [Chryseobacterium sp. Chry.R1]|uniref:reprolysin-like metallopeptidase n=1 Tax=Chryseobacterium sp. Chry.R1 TaxID=3139392 RepID=UPI0031F9F6EC
MKFYLLIALAMVPFMGSSQWKRTELRSQSVKKVQEKLEFSGLYTLDINALKQTLKNTSSKTSEGKGVVISIPDINGKTERFQVWEYSNMAPELQEKYPDIKSYMGRGIEDPSAYLRFSLSPVGFSSMITRSGNSEFIEPYSQDGTVYAVFDSKARKNQEAEPFICGTAENLATKSLSSKNGAQNKKAAGFNTFRLAMSCTGEYAQYHLTAAGTPANATEAQKKAVVLAAMNTTLTRLNQLFEKDLSLHFNLIANNDVLIFLEPTADPYTNGGPGEAQTQISARIAAQDYDMGHLLDKKNGNGQAGDIGVICDDNAKAGGWTAHNFPEGDKFDIDYVAHEMGHQMGANHTFTLYNASYTDASLVEPGSGSTIMAYTGIMGGNSDVQFNSFDYFHAFNLKEIKDVINGVACGVNVPFANPAPAVNAGADYTIPKSTPFALKATTTDANSAGYTYTWEQMDSGSAQTGTVNSLTYAAKPSGPTFRSLPPVSTPVRYFPDFNKVLAGVYATRWESLSSVARTLNFTVTARNNHPTAPQTSKDETVITVDAASGPFKITAPTFGQSLSSGNSATITWDVANTTQAPINTANVTIKLSTDGGQTFTVLAANTPNDGSEQITIPAGSTSANAYILIEAIGNVYYAVSPSFVIDYNVTGETCATYTYNGPAVGITDGPGGNKISSPKVIVPLMVNNTGVITKIKVTPTIAHPYVSDLAVGIESPQGSSALIWNRKCGNAAYSGITASFTDTGNAVACASPIQGETKSDESLAIFKGHKAQGEWKLFASDNYAGDVGTINSWSLEVCTRETQNLGTKDASAVSGNDIKIYPNPSNGNFFVKSRNLSGEIKVTLFDSSGRLISSDSYQGNGDFTKEFNMNIPKGVYIININSSKGMYSQKLIIK